MARLITRTFNAAVPLVARRPFVAAGRHFRPGDPFPWRDLPISERQAGLLFNNGKVMHPEAGTAPEAAPAPEPTQAQTPEPDPAPEPVDALDDMDMKQLRAIAAEIEAPTRTSRVEQRAAIREKITELGMTLDDVLTALAAG